MRVRLVRKDGDGHVEEEQSHATFPRPGRGGRARAWLEPRGRNGVGGTAWAEPRGRRALGAVRPVNGGRSSRHPEYSTVLPMCFLLLIISSTFSFL